MIRRLGGHGSAGQMLRSMFVRAFTAPTLADFWRYWNPVYGYFLARYIDRPLRRVFPPAISLVLTFAFCGFFLHDLPSPWLSSLIETGKFRPPFAACWFTLMGLAVATGTCCGVRFHHWPRVIRVLVHLSLIAVSFALTSRMLSLWT